METVVIPIRPVDRSRAVALIERASRSDPLCECGEPLVPVATHRQVWLECSARPAPGPSTPKRWLAAVTALAHTRRLIF